MRVRRIEDDSMQSEWMDIIIRKGVHGFIGKGDNMHHRKGRG